MFDINNYDKTLILFCYIISSVLILFLFRKKISSIIDPLVNHCVWISAHFTFLIAYIAKYGISYWALFFLFILLVYVACFNYLLVPLSNDKFESKYNSLIHVLFEKKRTLCFLYWLIVLLTFYSQIDFFMYAVDSSSVASWFLYKFVDLQGRDPLLRILGTGITPFFYLFSFINIFIYKERAKTAIFIIALFCLIQIFAGGRSSMLHLLFSIGTFILYFRPAFPEKTIARINRVGLVAIIVSLVVASAVSSFYSEDYSMLDGFQIIINRLVAAADGLEYYMKYNGEEKLPTGIWQYFLSVFAVYVKGLLHIDYKNVGTQLTELVQGDVEFAQGANYTIFLQVIVLGYYFSLFYVPLLTALSAKFRNNRTTSIRKLSLSYFFVSNAFTCITDLEYFVLVIISGVICYSLFIWPFFTFSLNFKKHFGYENKCLHSNL